MLFHKVLLLFKFDLLHARNVVMCAVNLWYFVLLIFKIIYLDRRHRRRHRTFVSLDLWLNWLLWRAEAARRRAHQNRIRASGSFKSHIVLIIVDLKTIPWLYMNAIDWPRARFYCWIFIEHWTRRRGGTMASIQIDSCCCWRRRRICIQVMYATQFKSRAQAHTIAVKVNLNLNL